MAGATHFYIALEVEFHYKLTPGTFAGITGSRMTDMKPETKEIFSCLAHMMMKELRGSTAGATRAHKSSKEPRAQYMSQDQYMSRICSNYSRNLIRAAYEPRAAEFNI